MSHLDGKSLIFISDIWIPEYDKNAGARCTFQYLKLMAAMELCVVFYPRDKKIRYPYAKELIEMGVSILIPFSIERWLSKWGEKIDSFYLHRPDSSDIIDSICMYKNACAKITYFANDIHHLRLRRQYNVDRNVALLKQAGLIEYSERKMFEIANTIHVVGSFEKEYLKRQYVNKQIEEIPLFIYDIAENKSIESDTDGRTDMIFVGGFRHSPNRDAIDWFLSEVWPDINIKLPEVKLHIVGTDIPDRFKNEENVQNIIRHGSVSDEVLIDLYRKTRLMVVPLRYGAGVKGKIIEAMRWRLPVITTPVGAEGITSEKTIFQIAKDAIEWVDSLVSLYSDTVRRNQIAQNSYKYILQKNSTNTAARIIEQCLEKSKGCN
jgi:glycosyltransferase involved in cell wall biosynthesis